MFAAEWRKHVDPFIGLRDIQRLAGEARETAQQIDAAVGKARENGASWAAIGNAAGLSRQGAQQRWGA